jgi:N-glycosylase/DNA lyase
MNITKTPLEEACKFLLQRKMSMEVAAKVFKEGKLLLFYQKNFYLTFIMDTDKNRREKIEIPIPYDIEIHEEDNLVYFDYRLKTLAKHAPEVENYLKVYSCKKNSNKFWNTILTIDANLK